MSVTLTGTGGLFTRWGKFFHALRSANRYLSDVAITSASPDLDSVGTSTLEILAQFDSADQQVPDGITRVRDSIRSALDEWKSINATAASNCLIDQVHRDVTLVSKDFVTAFLELQTQMIGAGTLYAPTSDVDANTVSATAAAVVTPANIGTGTILISVVRADGRNNELVYNEVLEAVCTTDAPTGGATARQESFTVRGEVPAAGLLAWNWPLGSGTTATLGCIDAAQDNNGNLLYNSDFDAYTQSDTNQPDYWGSPLVGLYGTDIFKETTTFYRGTSALRFTGTGGAVLSSIAQPFAVTTPAVGTAGTNATLRPSTVYVVCFFARKSAGLAAGTLQVRLVDGSNAQVNDDAGTANAVNVGNATLTTSFAAYGGFFRTPRVLPSSVKLNVRMTVAATSGEHVYVDDLAFCEADLLYPGGPYAKAFAGAVNFIQGDKFLLTVANAYDGEIQTRAWQAFDLPSLGLQIPSDSAGGEVVPDTLVG